MNEVSPFTSSQNNQAESRYFDFPDKHRLADLLIAALNEPMFADQWNCLSDDTFRPYAIAVLELSNAKQLSQSARQSLYKDMCLRKRIDVLSDVLAQTVPARILKLLGRTDWLKFTRRDWKQFFSIAINENCSGLVHVPIITNTLIRQYEQIPNELRLPALLRVVSNLPVPADRWIKLQGFINKADSGQLIEYRRGAGKLSAKGDFWDFYFQCEGKHKSPFSIPATLTQSDLLEPIMTPQEMVSESLNMENCLASLISRVHIGNRIYFKKRDGYPVNCELVRSGQQWKPGSILGFHNSTIPTELKNNISSELNRLAKSIYVNASSSELESREDFIAQLSQEARNKFSTKAIAKISTLLQSIQAKSISWSNGAYVILERKQGGYVQFMSSPDGNEFLIEIASHKYEEYMNRFLNVDVIDLIENAGFVWPFGKQNFRRWFSVSSQEDFEVMAETALAILSRIFGLNNASKLIIKSHIPD